MIAAGPALRRAVVTVVALTGIGLGGLAAPGVAGAAMIDVAVTFSAYDPPDLEVLHGDQVDWSNVSSRAHTVTADDGTSFSSPRLEPGDGFSHDFGSVGVFPYHCSIHPSITGTVRVEQLILDGPTAPVDPGTMVTLSGRAQPGTSTVSIERDEGVGYLPVTAVTPTPDGGFEAQVTATRTASYRAVAVNGASEPLRILVFEHPQFKVDVNANQEDRTIVHAKVLPKRANQVAVLQIHSREHFGWWPIARGKLNNNSQVRFKIAPSRAKARIVLTLADGATVLATSQTFGLR